MLGYLTDRLDGCDRKVDAIEICGELVSRETVCGRALAEAHLVPAPGERRIEIGKAVRRVRSLLRFDEHVRAVDRCGQPPLVLRRRDVLGAKARQPCELDESRELAVGGARGVAFGEHTKERL